MTKSRLLMLLAACAVVSPHIPATAQDANFPPRRPGLWEVVTVTEKPDKVPKISAKMCIDAATDRELMEFGLRMSKDTCARYEVKGKGQRWTIDAECRFGSVKNVSRTSITGDFQSKVSVRIEGTTEGMPGASGPQPTVMAQETRWISEACGSGMTPGDVMLDGGMKINIKQMQQLKKLIPNLQIR